MGSLIEHEIQGSVLWAGSIKRLLRIYSYRGLTVCQPVYWFCVISEPELVAEVQSNIGGKYT